MRTWVWTLLLVGVAVALAVVARDHAGNVVVLAPPYRIETSLAFALTALILLFVLLHLLLRLAGWTLGVGQRVRMWRQQRELVREHQRLEQGWVNLLQGHYVRAEHDFDQVAASTASAPRKVLACLSAARAAHAMQQFERTDAALRAAQAAAGSEPALGLAVACTAADLLLAQGRADEALALLEPLQNTGARHVHVQRLLLRVYLATPRWDLAVKLARSLARHRLADLDVPATIETAAANWLRAAPDAAARRAVWKALKSGERTMPEVALAAAEVFGDDPPFARKVLEDALEVRLDARLLTAYAQGDGDDLRQRLQHAEQWLRKEPNHAELLRVLGNLCLRGQLWGPARAYLQRSLQQRDDPRTHALLGSLHDRLDEPEAASRHWRLATAAVVGLTILDRDGALPPAELAADPLPVAPDMSAFAGDAESGLEAGPPALPPADDEPLPAPPVAPTVEDYEIGMADVPPRELADDEPGAGVPPSRSRAPGEA